ncbi:hypothetical protein OIU84_009800 [Salix udensis]|uniref:Uncharacterized protein n=1 Tax=Salix udensis TaxID=889485 RepID=A0AAD6JJA6_9ROSI|nr:hypothetical protein OIU84_009800 [Salix udensis]
MLGGETSNGIRFLVKTRNTLIIPSELEVVSFTYNSLTRNIRGTLRKQQHFCRLHFRSNNLGDGGDDEIEFLSSLTECSMLKVASVNIRSGGNHIFGHTLQV